jgi:hypothetical protein
MTERLTASGAPVNPQNSPSLIEELVKEINELLPAAVDTAGRTGLKWLAARGEKEVARVAEIKADILKKLGELELERQRLVNEREAGRAAETNRHKEANYSNRTERIRAEAEAYERKAAALVKVVSALRELRDVGIAVDAQVVARLLTQPA